jgi:diketogulonate reductase-like aldo/keto reductase
MSKNPVIKMNNGANIPAIGLGVLDREGCDKVAESVVAALETGYRLIDTAQAYANERQVGEGIARSGVPRKEIFVTSKLWLSEYGTDSAHKAFDSSLKKLGVDYLDLYLLHWPVPSNFKATIASYKVLEKLLADKRVRAIGVSNFSPNDLKMLMDETDIVPAVNQIELHPGFQQKELRKVHKQHGIVSQAWGPIGGSVRRSAGQGKGDDPLKDQTLTKLAEKHGKSPVQIILRWHLQNGVSAIPKSFRKERIAENFDIFDFTLSAEDMAVIDALDTGLRAGPDPDVVTPTTFSFVKLED